MDIKSKLNETIWILTGSLSLFLYWSIPLFIRVIFAIPGIMFIGALVQIDGIKLTTIRVFVAGMFALIFIFAFEGLI